PCRDDVKRQLHSSSGDIADTDAFEAALQGFADQFQASDGSSAAVEVTLPAVALLHRDHPREVGTVADAPFLGGPAPSFHPHAHGRGRGDAPAGTARALLSLPFALIGGIFASIAFAFSAIIVHLVPHATDQGFTAEEGGLVLAVWGVVMLAGNLASAVSDRVGRTPTYWAGALLGALSSLMLAGYAQGTPKWAFYLATALSGLGLGLVRPTASSLVADHFSGPGFGRVNGAAMSCFALAGAAGPAVTGAMFDAWGSYRGAFGAIAAFFLLGAILTGGLGRGR
ncbi:MAG: MFS transporter, partial [Nitrospinota bacterium]